MELQRSVDDIGDVAEDTVQVGVEQTVCPSLEDEYFESWLWAKETAPLDIAAMTSAQLAGAVSRVARRADASRTTRECLRAYAKLIAEADVDGSLLLAGGAALLVERANGLIRASASVLKNTATRVMKTLHALHKKKSFPEDTYWSEDSLLAQEYKGASGVAGMLQGALMLLPQEAIRYTYMCCDDLDVPVVDGFVKSRRQPGSQYLFKVVSVADVKWPTVIRKNFIYGVDDGDRWTLVASVDLQQHGSAAPGHWHLNRTPHGDIIPHYHGEGKSEGTFHGTADSCPIWWHLVPRGMTHLCCPDRPYLWELVHTT